VRRVCQIRLATVIAMVLFAALPIWLNFDPRPKEHSSGVPYRSFGWPWPVRIEATWVYDDAQKQQELIAELSKLPGVTYDKTPRFAVALVAVETESYGLKILGNILTGLGMTVLFGILCERHLRRRPDAPPPN